MYIYISTSIFAALALVWTGRNWANTAIKIFLVGMFVYGLTLSLEQMGYIIKQ